MNEETKFEVGDQVEWCGVRGVVVQICNNELEVSVCFDNNEVPINFYSDGKYWAWHTEPSLKLISKAKKKRKVKLYAYLKKAMFEDTKYWSALYYSISTDNCNRELRIPEFDKEVEIEQ